MNVKEAVRKIFFRGSKYEAIVNSLTSYEVFILKGLLNSPFPLKLFEAYRLACGEKVDGELVICSEEFAKKLLKSGLIRVKDNGYLLTKTAERILKNGMLDSPPATKTGY